MEKWKWAAGIAAVLLGFPLLVQAQDVADKLHSLHDILDRMHEEMLPMCKELIGVGRGIAGFAALFYIGSRIWRHLANAEPVDFYPLFRPFVLGWCIFFFPLTLGAIRGLMKPIVTGTSTMVKNSDQAVKVLLKQKEDAVKSTDAWKMYVGQNKEGDRDKWYKYTHNNADPATESWIDAIGNNISFSMSKYMYNVKNNVKEWMSEILKILFQAASLCINTLRTFQLIVLAIIGPIVFGLAVFDGFQHTLTAWLAKYLNVFMWLPVANIFGAIIGKVQIEMLKLDLGQLNTHGDTFFSATDTGYLIFMIIGIVGYFTVPSVAGFIVNAGGGDMGRMVTRMMSSSVSTAASVGGGIAKQAGSGAYNILNSGRYMSEGKNSGERGDGRFQGEGASGAIGRSIGSFMASKLSGNSSGKKE